MTENFPKLTINNKDPGSSEAKYLKICTSAYQIQIPENQRQRKNLENRQEFVGGGENLDAEEQEQELHMTSSQKPQKQESAVKY